MRLTKEQVERLAGFSDAAKVDAAYALVERHGGPAEQLEVTQRVILDHFEEYVALCRQCNAQDN